MFEATGTAGFEESTFSLHACFVEERVAVGCMLPRARVGVKTRGHAPLGLCQGQADNCWAWKTCPRPPRGKGL